MTSKRLGVQSLATPSWRSTKTASGAPHSATRKCVAQDQTMALSRPSLRVLHLAVTVLVLWMLSTAALQTGRPALLSETTSLSWDEESTGEVAKDYYGLQAIESSHDGFVSKELSTNAPFYEQSDNVDSELEKRIDLFSSRAPRKLKKKGQQFQCWLDGAQGVPTTKFSKFTDLAKWLWALDRQDDKDYEHVAK